jgi:predicted GH43/DUF377 family glycosyl hydrolase
MSGWEVAGIEPITMHRSNRLADMYVLSPFVWREGGMFHLLTRAVPRRDDDPRLKMAEIWHGTSEDGLHFEMESAPTLFPGPDLVDLDGCEDPTVRVDKGTMRVWYTGYNEQQKTGRLLLARGPAVAKLAKAGIAIDSSPDFTNPKESTVAAVGSSDWRMYFEYAANGASLIGQASADNLDGPWENVAQSPITPRPGKWDGWHLSAGPIIGEGTTKPTMFYNGAMQDASWRIGWVTFDERLTKLVDRCEEPLICPEDALSEGSTDIAFAASAVERNGKVLLYYSQSDQELRCATIRRG